MMHDLHLPIAKLHQYPINTNQSYLLEPAKWPNLLDLHVIERTFLGENKQYWAEAARANVRAIIQAKRQLAESNQLWDIQEEPLVLSQREYKNRLELQIKTATACFKEANKRRKTGFGLSSNGCNETIPLRTFYMKFWAFISNTQENLIFKNIISERALNTIRKEFFYEDTEDGGFGVGNHAFIKRIMANINFIELGTYDFIKLEHLTEKVSKELALFAGKQYKTPIYVDAAS